MSAWAHITTSNRDMRLASVRKRQTLVRHTEVSALLSAHRYAAPRCSTSCIIHMDVVNAYIA